MALYVGGGGEGSYITGLGADGQDLSSVAMTDPPLNGRQSERAFISGSGSAVAQVGRAALFDEDGTPLLHLHVAEEEARLEARDRAGVTVPAMEVVAGAGVRTGQGARR